MKTALRPLIGDHYGTLKDARTGKYRLADFVVQLGVPVAVSGLAVLAGARLVDAGQVIGGAAVMAGFSFGLAIFVFQLRLDATRDPRVPKGSLLLELIDELFSNVSYSVVVGLALVVATVAATSFSPAPPASEMADPLNAWWTWGITALALHYIATIAMCLKRVRAAYREMTI